jgi:phosphatidylethanolamine-binding protein (PEBP) family uncharacterized protein
MIIAAAAFTLLSATFEPNTMMPITTVAKDCGGENISPELHWAGAPAGTNSFSLLIHDPDAPRPGGYTHWKVANIPGTATSLEAGTALFKGYYGPCPPAGKVHHYNMTLSALDANGKVLGEAKLTGLYETTSPR